MSESAVHANINGAQIYYEMKGSGHPLLLIHAGVADSRMWDDQFDAFAEKYRVIRFDLRGFGRSNMPSGSFANYEDVRALLDFLEIKSASILGISFGGSIALDFTLAHPNYVKALILGAPSVSGTRPSARIKQFWNEEDALLEQGKLDEATELNLELWVDGPHRRPDQVSSQVRKQVRQMQMDAFIKEIPDDIKEVGLVPPAAGRLAEIQIPVQVLVGQLDLQEKVALADDLELEIPNCQKVVLPHVAHMLNMESPELFNKHVLNFLSTIK